MNMQKEALEALIRRTIAESRSEHAPLRTLRTIPLALAKRLAALMEEEALRVGVQAVVAVADAGGHPILVEVMDDAFLASLDVAVQKSYTSVALKMKTIDLKPLAQPGGSLYGIEITNQGKIVVFGGGEPLTADGCVIGGLGVSGGTEEEDTALAAYGAQMFQSLLRTES